MAEHWATREEFATLPCPNCGHVGLTRMIGAPKLNYTDMACNGEASSDAMGTAVDKWVKMRDQKARIEKKAYE